MKRQKCGEETLLPFKRPHCGWCFCTEHRPAGNHDLPKLWTPAPCRRTTHWHGSCKTLRAEGPTSMPQHTIFRLNGKGSTSATRNCISHS